MTPAASRIQDKVMRSPTGRTDSWRANIQPRTTMPINRLLEVVTLRDSARRRARETSRGWRSGWMSGWSSGRCGPDLGDGLGPVAHVEFAEDRVDVCLDRRHLDHQPGGDLGVAQALPDQVEHLGLPAGELRESLHRPGIAHIGTAEYVDQQPADLRAVQGCPVRHRSYGVEHLPAVGVLGEKSLGPGA